MAKERKDDYRNARTAMTGVIARVAREKLSHDRLLALRTAHVFETESYRRLTVAHKSAINEMVSAATDAWIACGAIVWTHEIDGEIVVSRSVAYDVSKIDTRKSFWRWREGFNVWYEQKAG